LTGIAVNEIERMEIVNTPGLYLGEYADKGIIHIVTKKKYTGLSLRGYVSDGVQNLASSHGETGKTVTQAIGYSRNKFTLNSQLSYQEIVPADTSAVLHDLNFYSIHSKKQLALARIEVGLKSGRLSQQWTIGLALFNDRLSHWQVEEGAMYAGYLSSYAVTPKSQVRLSLSAGQQVINNLLYYQYSTPYKKQLIKWQVGIGYDWNRYLTDKSIGLVKPLPLSRFR